MGPWNLVQGHIRGTYRCMWSIAPGHHIFGPFFTLNRAKIRSNVSFSSILHDVSTGFTSYCFFKLIIWVRNMGPRGHILGSFFTLNRAKIRSTVSFCLFCKMFPLDSDETRFLSSLELLLEVCRIWDPRGHIFLSFLTPNWAKICQKSVFVDFAKGLCWIRMNLPEVWRIWGPKGHILGFF